MTFTLEQASYVSTAAHLNAVMSPAVWRSGLRLCQQSSWGSWRSSTCHRASSHHPSLSGSEKQTPTYWSTAPERDRPPATHRNSFSPEAMSLLNSWSPPLLWSASFHPHTQIWCCHLIATANNLRLQSSVLHLCVIMALVGCILFCLYLLHGNK